MGTFIAPSASAMLGVAEAIDAIESLGFDVHTVSLVLNGQHGEFDLTIEATDDDMDDFKWTGVAHRSGGVGDVTLAT